MSECVTTADSQQNAPSAISAGAGNPDGSTCSASAIRARLKIYDYLARSAGTGNWPTDHALRCFLGMTETGEATWDDIQAVGGTFLFREVKRIEAELYADE